MLKKMLSLVLFCFNSIIFSQPDDFKQNYTVLISSGQLPEIYLQSATEKVNRDFQNLEKSKDRKDRAAKKKFYLNSNFQLDRVLRSGQVLFNDPVSKFVNRVADELFKKNPEVRKGLQIYVVKSEVVNAYAFDNGVILVNLGLIAQMDHEAQLAFILAHEASHIVKKHSLEYFVSQNRRQSEKFRTDVDMDEYKYSQEAELDADAQGVRFFRDSKYTYKGIPGAFNVLKYSYLPFDEVVFDKTFFEDSNLVFPKSVFLAETTAIKRDEDYEDSRSSHPNIKKRKEGAGRELGEFSDEGREKFLVGQNEFNKVREIARFECCRLDLLHRDYSSCIYNCYLLQKKYPDNLFLKTTVGKALFEIAALKSPENFDYNDRLRLDILDNSNSNTISFEYEKKEGSSQQVYHLFSKLNATQSTILALNYNWKLNKQLKMQDKVTARLCDSLFILLVVNNNKSLSYFNRISRSEYLRELNGSEDSLNMKNKEKKKVTSFADIDNAESDSKTKHIESSNEPPGANNGKTRDSLRFSKLEEYYDKYVFADFFDDDLFIRKFKRASDIRTALDERNRSLEKSSRAVNKGGIGVGKLVILDPFYLKLSEQHSDQIHYFEGDKKLVKFGSILRNNATHAEIDYDYVDSRTLKADETDRYNDYALFLDWMTEFLNHDFNANALVLNNDAAKVLREKYKTDHILWSGVINLKIKKKGWPLAVLGTLLIYPIPFTIPYLFRKEEKTYYLSVLYNLKENKMEFCHKVMLRMSDTNDFLNAFVYDTMLSIKSQPKMIKK